MANFKKLMMSAAAGGGALDVDDVFSTYLYAGNGTNGRQINNGIDLSAEGGMVWFKARTTAQNHRIFDTVRGSDYSLIPNGTTDQSDHGTTGLNSFDDDGFTLGNAVVNGSGIYGGDYASWTFRKAPKFFDVVTYTGNGSARTISHSLNTTPGLIICKPTSGTGQWAVWHRSNGNNKVLYLNLTYANSTTNTVWNNTAPTSTVFSVGASAATNETGVSYVAYLFAHNNGDGEFGPDGDADIIKCGSYTGSSSDQFIDLGFEPQWLMVKSSSLTQDWVMFDTMRGITDFSSERLVANGSSAGANSTGFPIPISANGFSIDASHVSSALNYNGQTYIYMAIRRGPMAVPESATEVFSIDTKSTPAPAYSSGFPVDMAIQRNISVATSNSVATRLIQQKRLLTDSTNAEENSTTFRFDYSTGYSSDANFNDSNNYSWMWKRAPGFFDVVAYTGDNVAGRTISHNLGVAPEMIWVKKRSEATDWNVYHSGLGPTKTIWLNQTSTGNTHYDYWYNTAPTSSVFSVGGGNPNNYTTRTYIAYLFATLPGISKVGSYTGNGGTSVSGLTQDIDCGFTSGARFVLIKATNAADHWFLYDSQRGIVAGNDSTLKLNTSDSVQTNSDEIDPLNAGFTVVNRNNQLNRTGREYIFYAIA